MPKSNNIRLKKKFGQHFLRDHTIVYAAIDAVALQPTSSVFEIGCGDGFLTREILQQDIERLWVFEIDADWVQHVTKTFGDDTRLTVHHKNILDVDFDPFEQHKPWILLANLPYQVTFPIFYLLQKQRHLLQEGVVMIQEEVAQKIVKTSGRGYGYPSLFLQYYFDFTLLNKVPPSAFYPPPKVFSRLIHFKPKKNVASIEQEADFWKFIKICFHQPRRTLRNNLAQSHIAMETVPEELLSLRAQQLSMSDLLSIWQKVLHP